MDFKKLLKNIFKFPFTYFWQVFCVWLDKIVRDCADGLHQQCRPLRFGVYGVSIRLEKSNKQPPLKTNQLVYYFNYNPTRSYCAFYIPGIATPLDWTSYEY